MVTGARDCKVLHAFDPGLWATGVATFKGGRLVACAALHSRWGCGAVQYRKTAQTAADWMHTQQGRTARAGVGCVVEGMVCHKGQPGAHPRLLELQAVLGGVVALVKADLVEVVPSTKWTSGKSKADRTPVLKKRLDAEETEIMFNVLRETPADNHKEVLDAVALGLWALGRL